MQIVNHSRWTLHYAVRSKAGAAVASGHVGPNERIQVTAADSSQSYRVELTKADAPGRHTAEDVRGDSIVELGIPEAPMTSALQYGAAAYSLYLTGVDQYVSWKYGFSIWALLYDSPLAIEFDGGSGDVLTGDILQVGANTWLGVKSRLTARGVGDWTASWSAANLYPSTWNWQIWTTSGSGSGQTISVGDEIYLISQATGGWAGNYLMQEPSQPKYLTIGTLSTAAMAFQVRTSSGGTSVTDADVNPGPPPRDVQGVQAVNLMLRIVRPGERSRVM
jgi:hypothetical protein